MFDMITLATDQKCSPAVLAKRERCIMAVKARLPRECYTRQGELASVKLAHYKNGRLISGAARCPNPFALCRASVAYR